METSATKRGMSTVPDAIASVDFVARAGSVPGMWSRQDATDQAISVPRFATIVSIAVAPPAWKAFLVTAMKTGLRAGELLALKWEDLDLVAGKLVVRRTLWHDQEGPPKGGRQRMVPLSTGATATLKAHRHLRGPYVFCDEEGGRLTHSVIKDVVPSTCKRAGLAKRITTHGLRHTFASHLVMRGASLKAVQELLGHESIEMTLRYAHLTPDVKREAVQLLDAAPIESVAPGGHQTVCEIKSPGSTGA